MIDEFDLVRSSFYLSLKTLKKFNFLTWSEQEFTYVVFQYYPKFSRNYCAFLIIEYGLEMNSYNKKFVIRQVLKNNGKVVLVVWCPRSINNLYYLRVLNNCKFSSLKSFSTSWLWALVRSKNLRFFISCFYVNDMRSNHNDVVGRGDITLVLWQNYETFRISR